MTPDFAQAKERERAIWSTGNYPEIARLLEPAARAIVDACAVSAGQEVLDVAAGSGNVAVACAGEGASVVASDLTPAMLELGRARSSAEGVEVEWVEADVEELPFEDASFDCVTSAFGAMFAPCPEVAARELFRVVRPGGTVGMANWTPQGFPGRMFAIRRSYPPEVEGPAPADLWGEENVVTERFEGLAGRVELDRRTLPWEFDSLDDMRAWFEQNAGTSVMARRAMPPDAYESMMKETMDLAQEVNAATDGRVRIDTEYLLVVARRRG